MDQVVIQAPCWVLILALGAWTALVGAGLMIACRWAVRGCLTKVAQEVHVIAQAVRMLDSKLERK